MRQRRPSRSTRSLASFGCSNPSVKDKNQMSHDKHDTSSHTSRLCVACERRQRSKTDIKLKGVACRRVFALSPHLFFFLPLDFSLSLGSPLFFHSMSHLHTRTLLTSFFLYFRSSHSPPGYAIRGRARGIFASRNAANWPKINTHVKECYPFSLSFFLLLRSESLYYRPSLAPSVVIDRFTANKTFSSNISHRILTKYQIK